MQFLGIGLPELIFILVLMIIVLGPQKMVEGAGELGKFLRKLTRSSFWKDVQKTSQEIRELPRKLMDDTGIDENVAEINRSLDPLKNPMFEQKTHAPLNPPTKIKENDKENTSTQ